MYDTVEEAKQKLDGSVVLFDNTPIFICQEGGKKGNVVLGGCKLPLNAMDGRSKPTFSESIADPRWDFRTLGGRLGYCETKDPHGITDAVFTSRIPTRHSRQGLDSRTVYVKCHVPEQSFPYEWMNIIHREGIVDTMRGTFRSMRDVYDLLINKPTEYRSLPLSRKLMLVWDRVTPPVLIYRGEKIGYTEDGKIFRLAKHKEFLREELVDMEHLNIS